MSLINFDKVIDEIKKQTQAFDKQEKEIQLKFSKLILGDQYNSCMYIAAGHDTSFLDNVNAKKYVCVDPLPSLISHYSKDQAGYANNKDEKSFIRYLCKVYKKYGFKKYEHDINNNLITFKNNKNQTIWYYYNMFGEYYISNFEEFKDTNVMYIAGFNVIKACRLYNYNFSCLKKIFDIDGVLKHKRELFTITYISCTECEQIKKYHSCDCCNKCDYYYCDNHLDSHYCYGECDSEYDRDYDSE